MIISGTGDKWVVGNPDVWNTKFMDWPKQKKLEQYHESLRLLENLIFCIDIPTIGAINGPGTHCEIATLCDITICSTRHLTHSILSRPWKQALVSDQGFHLTHQMYDMAIDEEGALERLMKMKGRLMDK